MILFWELLWDGPAGSLKEETMSPVPSACCSPSVFHDRCMMPSFTHILILILCFCTNSSHLHPSAWRRGTIIRTDINSIDKNNPWKSGSLCVIFFYSGLFLKTCRVFRYTQTKIKSLCFSLFLMLKDKNPCTWFRSSFSSWIYVG